MPTQPKAKTGFVYDCLYLEHQTTPGHPESPARLTAIVDEAQGRRGVRPIDAPGAAGRSAGAD